MHFGLNQNMKDTLAFFSQGIFHVHPQLSTISAYPDLLGHNSLLIFRNDPDPDNLHNPGHGNHRDGDRGNGRDHGGGDPGHPGHVCRVHIDSHYSGYNYSGRGSRDHHGVCGHRSGRCWGNGNLLVAHRNGGWSLGCCSSRVWSWLQ